jgi:hypothetical protein
LQRESFFGRSREETHPTTDRSHECDFVEPTRERCAWESARRFILEDRVEALAEVRIEHSVKIQ